MAIERTIGFVGGCAITQPDIPKEKRFIEVLRTKMKSDCSIETSFTFSSYSHFYELEKSIEKIINKQKVDLLIVHLRPQPLLVLSKFIIKKKNKNNKTAFFINPLVYRKCAYPYLEQSSSPVINQLALKPKSKPKLMGLNILLGRLFGLNKKAAKQIFNAILSIQSQCKQKDIKLTILGISPQPMTKHGNINCQELNVYLIKKCHDEGIEYVDSFSKMNNSDCFQEDELHLSEKGHEYLGDILNEGIKHFTTPAANVNRKSEMLSGADVP